MIQRAVAESETFQFGDGVRRLVAFHDAQIYMATVLARLHARLRRAQQPPKTWDWVIGRAESRST